MWEDLASISWKSDKEQTKGFWEENKNERSKISLSFLQDYKFNSGKPDKAGRR